jgi:WD40 repeat protein
VNAVAVVYSLKEYPNGLIITGSNDQTIGIHDIETNQQLAQLKEHEGAVCSLYFDNNSNSNLLYSGSFDSTAKVWNLNNLAKSEFQLKPSITIKGIKFVSKTLRK